MSAAFKEATRLSTGLLTSIERRCLLWIAARIPPSINPDHLTSLAGIAMLVAGFCYGFARQHRQVCVAHALRPFLVLQRRPYIIRERSHARHQCYRRLVKLAAHPVFRRPLLHDLGWRGFLGIFRLWNLRIRKI